MPEPYRLAGVARDLGLHPQTVKDHIYTSGCLAGKGKPCGCVEPCVSLARCIVSEMYSQLVERYVRSGETINARVHRAVAMYFNGLDTPNLVNH